MKKRKNRRRKSHVGRRYTVHEYDMVLVCESLTQSAIADEKSVLLLLVKETVSLPQSAIAN